MGRQRGPLPDLCGRQLGQPAAPCVIGTPVERTGSRGVLTPARFEGGPRRVDRLGPTSRPGASSPPNPPGAGARRKRRAPSADRLVATPWGAAWHGRLELAEDGANDQLHLVLGE